MKKVFISHSSVDKEIADEVCHFLEANGLVCWIAPRDVIPGKNYGAAIIDAIDQCGVFVLILSSQSNQSGQVVREVERAASSNSVIIPLRVELVAPSRDLEFYVSSSHWLDAPDKPLSQHLGKLLAAIQSWEGCVQSRPEKITPPAPPAAATRSPSRRSPLLFLLALAVLLVAAAVFLLFRDAFSPKRTPARPIASDVAVSPKVAPTATSPLATMSPPANISLSTPVSELSPTPENIPVIARVTASSVLPSQVYRGEVRNYEARNAVDGSENTAWVPNQSGVGEWIQIYFKSPVVIKSVSIYGGYGVDFARYQTNNRVRDLRLHLPDGSSQMLVLEDKMRPQRFELPRQPVVEWLRFEITSVYRGTKYDSTPVSQIAFNRD
ncbi:MAG: TIR domain-containing protein [Spartobacteria bacterium]